MSRRTREEGMSQLLSALEEGRGIDEVLARHPDPDERAELAAAAASLRALEDAGAASAPRPEAEAASKAAWLAEAERLRTRRPAEDRAERGTARRAIAWRPIGALLATAAAAALLTVGLSATPALPGTGLYPAKRGAERLLLAATPDEDAREDLRVRYAERRQGEIDALLASGGAAELLVSGRVEAIGGDGTGWRISGIDLEPAPDLVIEGDPALGELVHVTVDVRNGRVLAREILYDNVLHDHEHEDEHEHEGGGGESGGEDAREGNAVP